MLVMKHASSKKISTYSSSTSPLLFAERVFANVQIGLVFQRFAPSFFGQKMNLQIPSESSK